MEGTFEIPPFEPTNSTTSIPSDPLMNFSINESTGALTKVQEFAAGGMNPRHFSFNEDGSLVATALQADGRVVIIQRDVETGELGDYVGHVSIEGEVNCVIWG
jgi:6-phosphogluconolactonase (cycloisomerase 2 family)